MLVHEPYLIVLGAGESGIWSAVLARQKGYQVLLSDSANISEEYKEMCQSLGILFEEGGHRLPRLSEAEAVIKSPGIPDHAEVVRRCIAADIPVLSEIEFAARYVGDSHLIAITGSNGKTTTTSLVAHLLRTGGLDAKACGNIGISLAQLVSREPHEWYVLELSSFQLDHMYDFRAEVAILTNITPDHLDRYDHKLDNYADAKGRIFNNQTPSDTAIYSAEDPQTLRLWDRRSKPLGQNLTFTLTEEPGLAPNAFTHNGDLCWRIGDVTYSCAYADIPLQGPHNRLNMLAAGLAAHTCGVSFDHIEEGLRSFLPIEHRMEPCGEPGGVRFINDSKATNIDSTLHALNAMPTGRTVLLLGGTDKGNDYNDILPEVSRVAKALIFLTMDSRKLHHTFDPLGLPTADAHSMDEAFDFITSLDLREGDVVLLSPACASFDLFHNYEERGRIFKEMVSQLAKK